MSTVLKYYYREIERKLNLCERLVQEDARLLFPTSWILLNLFSYIQMFQEVIDVIFLRLVHQWVRWALVWETMRASEFQLNVGYSRATANEVEAATGSETMFHSTEILERWPFSRVFIQLIFKKMVII